MRESGRTGQFPASRESPVAGLLVAWGSENHTTALAGEEMHSPFWWLAPIPFQRGGRGTAKRWKEDA
jgi:hypothetical protein